MGVTSLSLDWAAQQHDPVLKTKQKATKECGHKNKKTKKQKHKGTETAKAVDSGKTAK